jgi:hypothetical protein
MPAVVLFIIALLVAFLVLKSLRDARQGTPASSTDDGPTTGPQPTPRSERQAPRQAHSSSPIDEEALTAHVTKLRQAVSQGLISGDEAVASVIRHTEGGLSEEAARKLLDIDEAA